MVCVFLKSPLTIILTKIVYIFRNGNKSRKVNLTWFGCPRTYKVRTCYIVPPNFLLFYLSIRYVLYYIRLKWYSCDSYFQTPCEFLNNSVVECCWRMMERKLEKVINLFANAIFGDFFNYYVVEFLMCYGNNNWKSGNFFLMYFLRRLQRKEVKLQFQR